MSDATTAAHAPPSSSPEAVSSLRKLKETEAAWSKRLEESRARGETKIKYALAARERALADARRDADAMIAQRLRDARGRAEVEGRRILEEGRNEAMKLGRLTPEEVGARMDEVLSAVLGELRTPASTKASSTTKAAAVAAR